MLKRQLHHALQFSQFFHLTQIQKILVFNPFYHFIVLFRDPLMNNMDEKFYQSFFICLLLMISVFFINLKIYKYYEKKIVLYL